MEISGENGKHLHWNLEEGDNNVEQHELDLHSTPSQKLQQISLDDPSQQAEHSNHLMTLPLLGLNLRKSESLKNMIEFKVFHRNSPYVVSYDTNLSRQSDLVTRQVPEKLKASNFPVSMIVIGTWKWESRYEGDLVAKCYFAKKKLVWELLNKGLKSKIEIQWTDVLSLSAQIQESQPGILNVELNQPPTFYHEMDPQPRKHTQWKLTSDFTNGQASLFRRHTLYFPPGVLDKNYEKLVQSDNHLHQRSQVPFPSLESPFFDDGNIHNPLYLNLTNQTPKINHGFHFSYKPSLPPHQHLEILHYHESLPSLCVSDLSSPISVIETFRMNERVNNMQTQFWFQDQSQKNMPHALLGTQVNITVQDGNQCNIADGLLEPQVSILESSPVPTQSFSETTVTAVITATTAMPGEEHALREVERHLFDDSIQTDRQSHDRVGILATLLARELRSTSNTNAAVVAADHVEDELIDAFESDLNPNTISPDDHLYPQSVFYFPPGFSYDQNNTESKV